MFSYTKGILVGVGMLALFLLLTLFLSIVTVDAGERGVVMRLGAVQDRIMQEGLNFKAPFIETVKVLDVKTEKIEYKADGASKDLQDVQITVALNYHLRADQVNKLWQEIGGDYRSRIIQPAIEESVKSASAKFTAEELITRRADVKQEVKVFLKDRLEKAYMLLDDLSIVNFQFSETFDAAIEAKVTAEQEALAEKNRLEKVKFQAQQKIEQAKAEAEAIRIRSAALANNAKLVELEAVQRWNGVMPVYMLGDSIPFLNLK